MFIQFSVRESFKVIVTRDDLIDAVMAVMPKAYSRKHSKFSFEFENDGTKWSKRYSFI